MIVAAHQPYFAPFAGFFYKAHRSEVFVVLDTVQFPRGTTWISRNRFKNDQGTLWMTIPVRKRGLGLQRICDVLIAHDGRWERKHLESFRTAYGHAPYLEDHWAWIESLFGYRRLLDLNLAIIRYLWAALEIKTELVLLSELGIASRGARLLVDICRRLGAERFLVQRPGARYLSRELFAEADIEVLVCPYPKPVYPQLWGDFVPNLSVLDLLLNCGPRSKAIALMQTD